MILNLLSKKKNNTKYILKIVIEEPYPERIIDAHIKHETYMSDFIGCQNEQSKKVLIYEIIPKVASTELAHSILSISSVIRVSINKKEHQGIFKKYRD